MISELMGRINRLNWLDGIKSEIKQASELPRDQRIQLASGIEDFISKVHEEILKPSDLSERMKLREISKHLTLHRTQKDELAPMGFNGQSAYHGFCADYLAALTNAKIDLEWFKEVHATLNGIRNELKLQD